jgi:hypothetical protein
MRLAEHVRPGTYEWHAVPARCCRANRESTSASRRRRRRAKLARWLDTKMASALCAEAMLEPPER